MSVQHSEEGPFPRRGKDRKGEASSWLCGAVDLLQNCLKLRLDFIVGEAEHPISFGL